jgi:ssRNA-specific RNase YbeY (16S rRNA maturation enzyme)
LFGFPYVLNKYNNNQRVIDAMIPVFLVHGFLHLIGYEHDTAAQFRRMKKREDLLLDFLEDQKLLPQGRINADTLKFKDEILT